MRDDQITELIVGILVLIFAWATLGMVAAAEHSEKCVERGFRDSQTRWNLSYVCIK